MVCIFCGNSSTSVTNSRPQKQLNQVWRRRFCPKCQAVFTTHEKIDLSGTIAVRNNAGELTHFSRDALLVSVYESCKHRPHALEDAAALVQTIIAALQSAATNGVLEKSRIAFVAHTTLSRFDRAAANVYAAYHKLT
jgi:transcriptional regulator NrdR family protein